MTKITRVLFQTNKIRPEAYIVDMILSKLGKEWKYEFYTDEDIITFFTKNPLEDLPNIIDKFYSLPTGAHKSDLFRYYYLFINGGFFMDSDAMIYDSIDTIVTDMDFVSVNVSNPSFHSIFQGILGSTPRNKIIQSALYHAYHTDIHFLIQDYHYWCKQLYSILQETETKKYAYKIQLFKDAKQPNDDVVNILNHSNKIIFKHFWRYKKIQRYSYIVSLTTIPSKFGYIDATIDSLLSQTILPDIIVIHIPKKYSFRMKDEEIFFDEIQKFMEKYKYLPVYIHYINNDYGPGTKLLGLFLNDFIDKINIIDISNTYILILDDDLIYKNYMIEYFEEKNPNGMPAVSYYVYQYKNILIAQAANGFFIKLNVLSSFIDYYNKIMDNDILKYHDDFYISYYFHLLGIHLESIYYPNNTLIYDITYSSEIDALHNLTGEYSRSILNDKSYDILQKIFLHM